MSRTYVEHEGRDMTDDCEDAYSAKRGKHLRRGVGGYAIPPLLV